MRFLLIMPAALLMLASVACSAIGGSQPIVFNADMNGNLEIFSIDPSSPGFAVNLTESGEDEYAPRVSPDGQSLAFISGKEDDNALRVISLNGDTHDAVAISAYHGAHRDHHWDPTSQRLTYLLQNGGDPEAYIVASDGSSTTDIASITPDEIGGWSYDGSTVSLVIRDPERQGIYLRNPDGVNQIPLTNTPDYNPVWSPTAHQLAFISDADGNPEVYVMNTDATERRRLTQTPAAEYGIAWSPDGRKIAYVSEQDGNPEVYVVDIRSGSTNRLTRNNVPDNEPVWSPDSNRIAFVSYLDGDGEIFVMDADGMNQMRLTNNEYDDFSPSW